MLKRGERDKISKKIYDDDKTNYLKIWKFPAKRYYGVEVRSNRSGEFHQSWHWLAMSILGIAMGEMFHLDEVAEDCAKDGVYEFLLVAPVLPFKNGAGSPVNPLAIK